AISSVEGQYITLYSFDRCSGDLMRMNTFHTSNGLFTGVAFSPSEQYLYADDNTHLWQWDLLADDIAASQTLVDTFDGFIQPGWLIMDFGPMVNGPDGKIYIVPSTGSSKYMHVIDQPNLPASECRFWQHHTRLNIWNNRTAPNLPNYRLGPLDESDCDSLGLNNLPVSRWRKEQDIPGQQSPILFTDLSFYNPKTWYWEFDDGATSTEPSPVHDFQPGLYHVCLTVSNEYASDSSCQWVNILPTGLKEELDRTLPDIDIIPNPFKEYISITSRSEIFRTASLQLYDMHGRLIFDQPELTIPVKLYLPDFPPGVYLCNIRDENGNVRSVKLMKQ
ncbi:MAG TPA: T9SS type A sorting domain-containing protein, partial [Saprospiraceae bacterium]|nr:T9SS type A sorting domain-containing protein [Saprospiraceae bacterium]